MFAPSIRNKENITDIQLRRSVKESTHSVTYSQSISNPQLANPCEEIVVIDQQEVIFTGIRDTASHKYNKGSYNASFTARSRNSLLVDSCMGTLKQKTFQFAHRKMLYRDLCNEICSRFEIPVEYEAKDNPIIPYVAYSIDEKALSILSKYAIEHQKMFTSNADGGLVVFHGSRSINTLDARTILTQQIDYDDKVYFRLFGSYRKSTINEVGQYRVRDTQANVRRFMVEKSTQPGLLSRADVMRSTSEAGAAKIMLTVDGWRDAFDNIYDCGNIVTISNRSKNDILGREYYIEQILFSYNNKTGKQCDLTLIHPNSYDVDKRVDENFL